MKLFEKLNRNSDGFGHLELLIIVVVIVAVAVTGILVYENHKNTNTAHAGSYGYGTNIGTINLDKIYPGKGIPNATVKVQACKLAVTHSQKALYQVEYLATLRPALPKPSMFTVLVEDSSSENGSNSSTVSSTNSWQKGGNNGGSLDSSAKGFYLSQGVTSWLNWNVRVPGYDAAYQEINVNNILGC